MKPLISTLIFILGLMTSNHANTLFHFNTVSAETETRTVSSIEAVMPVSNHGKKWRVGYIQGGIYESYQRTLLAVVQGLMNRGWIEQADLPKQDDLRDNSALWQWMAKNLNSNYLKFVEDAYWSANWDKEQRFMIRNTVLERLNETQDIDFMLAMGTWAGQDMASNAHQVPTMVLSTTDPIAAGIILSVNDSGFEHIHAKVDPDRHQRQVRLFYDIIPFKRLGIVYENTQEGRSFSAIDAVEKVAGELGFKLVRCYAVFNDVEPETAEQNLAQCYQELAPKIDALYRVRHPGATRANMPKLVQPLLEHNIPSFSQAGSQDVKRGILFSMALSDFKFVGQFYADTIAKILNGKKPRDLPQFFRNPPKIALNMKTAQLIGFEPSIEMLGVADEVYQDIEQPQVE